jgi:SAM-dependent methyltransferase
VTNETVTGFSDRANVWAGRVGLARDVVRQELVRRQLAGHLPSAGRALDVGCGQGTQALALARAGFDVTGVDPSPQLLAIAAEAVDAEPLEVRSRVRFVDGGLPDLPGGLGDFDVVCCHGVVMYLPELDRTVAELAGVPRPGGVVSVLSRNRAGIALRAGLTGDWQGAIDGIAARHYRNRLGVEAARGHDPAEIHQSFVGAGLDVEAWYGVRLLTDHWDDAPTPGDIDRIVDAEAALGAVDPYRQVAALTHTIGRRREASQ